MLTFMLINIFLSKQEYSMAAMAATNVQYYKRQPKESVTGGGAKCKCFVSNCIYTYIIERRWTRLLNSVCVQFIHIYIYI